MATFAQMNMSGASFQLSAAEVARLMGLSQPVPPEVAFKSVQYYPQTAMWRAGALWKEDRWDGGGKDWLKTQRKRAEQVYLSHPDLHQGRYARQRIEYRMIDSRYMIFGIEVELMDYAPGVVKADVSKKTIEMHRDTLIGLRLATEDDWKELAKLVDEAGAEMKTKVTRVAVESAKEARAVRTGRDRMNQAKDAATQLVVALAHGKATESEHAVLTSQYVELVQTRDQLRADLAEL